MPFQQEQRNVGYLVEQGVLELLPSGSENPYRFIPERLDNNDRTFELSMAYLALSQRFHFDVVCSVYDTPFMQKVANIVAESYGLKIGCNILEKDGRSTSSEGSLIKGFHVLIVHHAIDEFLESAIANVRSNGDVPIGCIVAFDRQEGEFNAEAFSKTHFVEVVALCRFADLMATRLPDRQVEACGH